MMPSSAVSTRGDSSCSMLIVVGELVAGAIVLACFAGFPAWLLALPSGAGLFLLWPVGVSLFCRTLPCAESSERELPKAESDAEPAEDKEASPTRALPSSSGESVCMRGGLRRTSMSARAFVLTRSSSDDSSGRSDDEVRSLIIASLCTPSRTNCLRAQATLH